MIKKLILVLLMINILSIKAQYKVELQLHIAENVPTKSDHIFLAGDFNGWHTTDLTFQFHKNKKGIYSLKFSLPKGVYQYKIVRGDWQNVEVDKQGNPIENRRLVVDKAERETISIANWADNFKPVVKKSTAAANVHFLDTAFVIPQLSRTRRVWVYLPQDYFESERKYPVIYMQDGQNVFDDATAFSGEWGVDEYLNSLPKEKQCIVVAVDNGGSARMNEYNPYNNAKFGKGCGKEYATFLAETLKPFVDAHYRTLAEAKCAVAAGSSMGGLISFYTALHYPNCFGVAGVFSPSFWIAPKLYNEVKNAKHRLPNEAFYFYAGAKESEKMIANVEKMQSLLTAIATVKVHTTFHPDGVHSEKYWRISFPDFYQWCLQLWQ